MKPSPAFQLYVQDFLVGTAEMSAEEVGGYIRLLCYQWEKLGVPSDNKKLANLTGITDPYLLGNVVGKFGLSQDDGLLKNKRLEEVRAEQEEYRLKQSENGKKGGNPAFQKGKHNPYYNPEDNRPLSSKDNPKDNPHDKPKINSSSSSSSSINKNTEKTPTESSAITTSVQRIFTDLWTEEFKKVFSQPYDFQSSKDGVAAASLVKIEGYTPQALVDVAKKAWCQTSKFNCKHSVTIAGFRSRFNQIREELGILRASSPFGDPKAVNGF